MDRTARKPSSSRKPPILSCAVPVESLRTGDYVDFGLDAAPPRIWRVGTTRKEDDFTVIVWLPALPGYNRRWTGRYAPGQLLSRVSAAVMKAIRG